jgi:hypothetical protein
MAKPFDSRNQWGVTRDDGEDRIHNREADLERAWGDPYERLFVRLDPLLGYERPDASSTRHFDPPEEDA